MEFKEFDIKEQAKIIALVQLMDVFNAINNMEKDAESGENDGDI